MVEVRGSINVTDAVIKSIVGRCAMEVPGVAGLSGSVYQNLVSWGGQPETKGIDVYPGDEENTKRIDLRIVIESGQPIPTVAENLQRSIKEVVEKMTGLEVSEVNVYVEDVQEKPESESPPVKDAANSR